MFSFVSSSATLRGINPAYIIGKRNGFDIRQHGSGNAVASNAIILKGKKAGAFSISTRKICAA